MSVSKKSSFVVAANRLPVRWSDEESAWQSSPGGLVSALRPILQEREGTWVGWTGQPDQELAPFENDRIEQHPVPLSASEIESYYHGFCNATIGSHGAEWDRGGEGEDGGEGDDRNVASPIERQVREDVARAFESIARRHPGARVPRTPRRACRSKKTSACFSGGSMCSEGSTWTTGPDFWPGPPRGSPGF